MCMDISQVYGSWAGDFYDSAFGDNWDNFTDIGGLLSPDIPDAPLYQPDPAPEAAASEVELAAPTQSDPLTGGGYQSLLGRLRVPGLSPTNTGLGL